MRRLFCAVLVACCCACGSGGNGNGNNGGGNGSGERLPEYRFFRIPVEAVESLDYEEDTTIFRFRGFAACMEDPAPANPCPVVQVSGLVVYQVGTQFYVVNDLDKPQEGNR